jgi:hypothetical protein
MAAAVPTNMRGEDLPQTFVAPRQKQISDPRKATNEIEPQKLAFLKALAPTNRLAA